MDGQIYSVEKRYKMSQVKQKICGNAILMDGEYDFHWSLPFAIVSSAHFQNNLNIVIMQGVYCIEQKVFPFLLYVLELTSVKVSYGFSLA